MSFSKKAKSDHQKRKERQEKERKQNEGKQLVTDLFSKKGEHKLEHEIYNAKMLEYLRDR